MGSKWRLSDIPQLKTMIAAMWANGDGALSDEQLEQLNLTVTEGQALVYAAVCKLEMKEKTPVGAVSSILSIAYSDLSNERCDAICLLAHAMIIDKGTKKNFLAWHKAYKILKKKL